MPPERARELALALAPVEDDEAGVGGARVPELRRRCSSSSARASSTRTASQRAGASAAAGSERSSAWPRTAPFSIDLRADGPHGLVAGMTGAGKSELLQTLIASLALSHPPDRLALLLVDYKGGAAFKDCVDLPHTVGLVTDLDAHLTQRALASLNAELQRRERVLRDAGAKDLADLEARDPASAPPSLLIAIDEFATLATEVPDFVEGIVDVAQRGRSLGVHLLLATQRPGGVVSENIRANTNLRIALRVNEPAESTRRDRRPRRGADLPRTPGPGLRAHGTRRADGGPGGLRRQAGSTTSPAAAPRSLVEPFDARREPRRERRSDEAEAGETELTRIVGRRGRGGATRGDRAAGVAVARAASGGARPGATPSPGSARSTSHSGSCNARSSSTWTPTAASSSTARAAPARRRSCARSRSPSPSGCRRTSCTCTASTSPRAG